MNTINILEIGSKVVCKGTSYSGRFNKHFVTCYLVEDVLVMKGWRTHALCKYMFAMSSHKMGLCW